MVRLLLWLSLVTLSECKSLTVNPRLKRRHGPIELSTEHLKENLFEGANRQKRAFEDYYGHGSDWGNNITINKSVLPHDAHGIAYMEWGGTNKNSDTIVVLTVSTSGSKESTLYVSMDYGNTFTVKDLTVDGAPAVPAYIFQSPTNHQLFILNDKVNKAVITSEDEGKTWNVHSTSFTPSTIAHHPSVERLLLAYDQTTMRLYLSRDFGGSFEELMTNDQKIKDYSWGTSSFDGTNDIFVVVGNVVDEYNTVYRSSDFFKTNKIIDAAVVQFELVDDFYFYVKKSTHKDHGEGDMDLFISYDRARAVKAQFPPNVLESPTNEFYVADAGEGQAFVAVSHTDNRTNLYVTEHKSKNMVLTLERVLFTNQASYDQISWLRGVAPFVDFQGINGLPGVFVASQLDPGSVGHRQIHTVITYNKGGTWQYVQPPKLDRYGEPTDCFLPNCSLQLSLMFGSNYPSSRNPPMLTKENAPGVIIASGNIGRAHSIVSDVFMSSDGGAEWSFIFRGQWHYQVADHGGVTVAVKQEPTTYIMYSHDEGMSWFNKTISDVPVRVYGLITEPGSITTVFNVYAMEVANAEWVIFTIDFKDSLGAQCTDGDFMVWSLRDELKNTECVLGKDTHYERKRPTAHCFIGEDYKRFVSDKPCPCQATDFECDFLYYRASPGDPCIMVEGISESWFIPTDCQPGKTYQKSLGYVKIEGDMCVGGEEAIFSDKETKCPDQNLTVSITAKPANSVAVDSPVQLEADVSGYVEDVYFTWYINDNTNYTGMGIKGATFKHSFSSAGVYFVSVLAHNGAEPSVATAVIQVDKEISGLTIVCEPTDPAVSEPVICLVSNNDQATDNDITRLRYEWSTGTTSTYPFLIYSFSTAGSQTVSCNISNSISNITVSTSFYVSDLTVTSLNVIAADMASVDVMWDPPTNRPGLIASYTLKYRDQRSGWHQLSTSVNASQNYYHIGALQPSTEYTVIIVTSSTGGGASMESPPKSATTLPMNSLDAAGNVRVEVSGQEAKISWGDPGGSVQGYDLEYWMSDRPNQVKSHASKGRDTGITITDLTAGALYSFRVKTLYQNKLVSYSYVKQVTIEGTTPQEITGLKGISQNSSAVVLLWGEPSVPVDGYKVYNTTSNKVLVQVTTPRTTLLHLAPYTSYSFYVVPYTGSREGPKSAPVTVQTFEGVPGPVENLKCYMSNGRAELSWHQPSTPNGPISQYLIYVEDDSLSSAGIPSAVDANTLSLALPDQLQEYKIYKFSIAVQGRTYVSKRTYTSCRIESKSGAPGPPTETYVKEVGYTNIQLMWRAPVVPEDTTTYEVRYAVYSGETRIGSEFVEHTSHLYITLNKNIYPSTQYRVTIAAKNSKGVGAQSQYVIATTLSPPIGSIEYELKFLSHDVDQSDLESFWNSMKSEIVSITKDKVSRSRLLGTSVTHEDTTDIKVSIWIAPRESGSSEMSAEEAVRQVDEAVKAHKFLVGASKPISGKQDHVFQPQGSHHDVAEIVIPGVCGLVIVVLVAGLLYYRNKYQHLTRIYTFRSRYRNREEDDVNIIECADETEGVASTELGRGGALTIQNIASEPQPSRPRGIKNFFERFNYTPVDQQDPGEDLTDDDEEHLLPL